MGASSETRVIPTAVPPGRSPRGGTPGAIPPWRPPAAFPPGVPRRAPSNRYVPAMRDAGRRGTRTHIVTRNFII